jgi:hypothetical protein
VPPWSGSLDRHAPLHAIGNAAPDVRVVRDEIDLPCCTARFAAGYWRHARGCPMADRPVEVNGTKHKAGLAAALRGDLVGDDQAIAKAVMPWRRA